LTTWKLAEDGDGSILRLQETSGHETLTTVSSPYLTVTQAWVSSLLEEKRSELSIHDGTISTTLKPFEVQTIRMHATSKLTSQKDTQ
jgi:alpha-mannosidase